MTTRTGKAAGISIGHVHGPVDDDWALPMEQVNVSGPQDRSGGWVDGLHLMEGSRTGVFASVSRREENSVGHDR